MSTIIDRLEGPPDKKAVEEVEAKECSICGIAYVGFGNNAWPINRGRCCNMCNTNHVITARMAALDESQNK